MRAVVLTGFMGTGKSEVGKRLAKRLGRAFVDTDELVEARAGKSVPAIFRDDGESRFRALEREAVADATARAGTVIALGGGAILDDENVARVRASGVLVCLTASADTILKRIGDVRRRPLLAQGDARANVERLLAERREAYGAADVTVDTSARTADQVVEEIRTQVAEIERSGRWKPST